MILEPIPNPPPPLVVEARRAMAAGGRALVDFAGSVLPWRGGATERSLARLAIARESGALELPLVVTLVAPGNEPPDLTAAWTLLAQPRIAERAVSWLVALVGLVQGGEGVRAALRLRGRTGAIERSEALVALLARDVETADLAVALATAETPRAAARAVLERGGAVRSSVVGIPEGTGDPLVRLLLAQPAWTARELDRIVGPRPESLGPLLALPRGHREGVRDRRAAARAGGDRRASLVEPEIVAEGTEGSGAAGVGPEGPLEGTGGGGAGEGQEADLPEPLRVAVAMSGGRMAPRIRQLVLAQRIRQLAESQGTPERSGRGGD